MSRKCRLLTVGIIAVGKIVLNGGREKKLVCTRISLIRHFYPRLIIEVQHFTQVLLNCNLSFPPYFLVFCSQKILSAVYASCTQIALNVMDFLVFFF